MTGLSEVREKLEEARHLIQSGGIGEKAMLAMRHGAIAEISEALVLLESVEGEQMPLHEDPGPRGRIWRLIADEVDRASRERSYKPKRIDAILELVFDDWVGFITKEMDRRAAILGTESENGADG